MKPKITFNSRLLDAPTTMFYKNLFIQNSNINFNDYNNYCSYDIALFTPYEEDIPFLFEAKKINPKLLIGYVDPRNKIDRILVDKIDFFIVDSIEMADYFIKYNKKIHRYYQFPLFEPQNRKHIKKKKIIIGYHGNKVHLEEMDMRITRALDNLASCYDLEFNVIYNIDKLGKWEKGLPQNIKVNHIQWNADVYTREMMRMDIGIIPSLLKKNNINTINNLKKIIFPKHKKESHYQINFKISSNAGRLFVFARLGIPVVADFLPSHFEFINDGFNGYLSYSTKSWERNIEKLILNHEIRNKFSAKLQSEVNSIIDPNIQINSLIRFCKQLITEKNDV
jgi:glycosyltransferase involved in cell wall biosynthesis